MELSLTQDILPVTEFKKKIKDTFARVHRTGQPVVLTVNGRADAVLVDAKVYEGQMAALRFHQMVAEGEAAADAGEEMPFKDAISKLRTKHGLQKKR